MQYHMGKQNQHERVSLQIYQIPKTEIRGLITLNNIRNGQDIWVLAGEKQYRSRYTIEQNGKHYVDGYVMYMNHSCNPNCKIENKVITAVRDIRANEQLTFDYHTTESIISSPFECGCGYEKCRGKII